MKILSRWTNPKYPGKAAQIEQTEDGKLEVSINGSRVGLMPDAWIAYEKILWADGWRKVIP